MDSIILNARAKVNLSLDVIKKRHDGYHDLQMIMQTVELHDSVSLEVIDSGIEVECDNLLVPAGKENIAYRAAELLINRYEINRGIRIRIQKRIPIAAGLAGGSSDAAAVFNGMNGLFSLGLDEAALMLLGKSIGADVPYCIKGGTMLAEGIGEILTGLPPLQGINIVLVKPKIEVSTAWVYKNLNFDKIINRPDTQMLINAIKESRIELLAKNMVNVLETVTLKEYSVIEVIKKKLVELGALGSIMSGSGPTVFGIFRDVQAAENAINSLNNKGWECFLTKTICEER